MIIPFKSRFHRSRNFITIVSIMFSVIFMLLIIGHVKSLVTERDYAQLPPVFEIDDFDRCMLLGDDALYCTIDFQLTPVDIENPTKIWKQIEELSENPRNYRHDKLRHGICVPYSCPNISKDIRHDLEKCYSKKYKHYGISGTIKEMHCQTNKLPPYDFYDISILFVFIVYSVLLLVASIFYDPGRINVEQNRKTSSVKKILSCFSIQNNWRRLTTMKDSPDTEALQCIQGVRFWNMFLVICSHAFLCRTHGPIINTKTVEEFWNRPLSHLIQGLSPLVVQIFFLLSSWLLTYHVFMVYGNGKQLKISHLLQILFNRYLRLTPALAAMLGIHSTLTKYIGKGPFWYHMIGREYESCRENGWSNLLYINNYVNPSRMCMSQTWYLAADTQLFIIGLCVLAAMKKFPENITRILGFGLIIGIFIPGLLCFINNYDIIQYYPENLYTIFLNSEGWHILFSSGYSNIGALIVGIFFGYNFYIHKDENILNTKIREAMVYVISIGICCLSVASTFYIYSPQYIHSRLIASIWWSVSKNALCVGAAILIFGMTRKLGWFLLWICCWTPVRYLSRLTYSAFLVHIFLVRAEAASMRSPRHFNDYTIVTSSLELVTVSYIFAVILCITCEMPITGLQKLWFSDTNKMVDKTTQRILNSKEGHSLLHKNK